MQFFIIRINFNKGIAFGMFDTIDEPIYVWARVCGILSNISNGFHMN
jgi:lipoprotein signal peptidase